MVTAADRAELAQFIGTAVLPGKLRVYGSNWELWKHFLEVHGAGTDAYLIGLPESEKAAKKDFVDAQLRMTVLLE